LIFAKDLQNAQTQVQIPKKLKTQFQTKTQSFFALDMSGQTQKSFGVIRGQSWVISDKTAELEITEIF